MADAGVEDGTRRTTLLRETHPYPSMHLYCWACRASMQGKHAGQCIVDLCQMENNRFPCKHPSFPMQTPDWLEADSPCSAGLTLT